MNRRLLLKQRQQPPVHAAEYAGSRPADRRGHWGGRHAVFGGLIVACLTLR